MLAEAYATKAAEVLPDGGYKKLVQTISNALLDAYMLETDTASLDDLMRIVRLYKLDGVQKYDRAGRVMSVADAEVQQAVDLAAEAGIVKRGNQN